MRRDPPISPKEAEALGWRRVDPKPWTKLRAEWHHKDGYVLKHCGHPTALYPWALYDAQGRFIRTGARGEAKNPTFGGGWESLRAVMTFVEELVTGKRAAIEWPA